MSDASEAGGPPPAHAEELLRALSTALRSFRLYGGESPALERFIAAFRQKLQEIFDHVPQLRLQVEEQQIRLDDRVVYPSGGESGDMAFLFYKDGVRELTLLPALEHEVERFLGVLARAPQLREEEDDLVTLLWEADLQGLRYEYVEPNADAVDLPGAAEDRSTTPVDPREVRQAAAEPSPAVTRQDFKETLYFLDEAELRQLAEEVRREASRDLWVDILSGLYDRLEDGPPDRQVRIIGILVEILPSMLSSARFDAAAGVVGELVDLASRGDVLVPASLREIRSLFSTLAAEQTITQLVQTLEGQPEHLENEGLGALLRFFPPESLAPLMRSLDRVSRPDLRRTLEQAVERLAEGHREHVVRLLSDADPVVVAGAASWAARLGIGSAVPELVRLLEDGSSTVRAAGIHALQQLRASTVGRSIIPLLDDPEREVRIAAARALSALEFAPAKDSIQKAITSKEMRSADRTEKLAFFEAFGRLAGTAGLQLLDRTLNGRSWLGRVENSETRACAAVALARVGHPSARASLAAAAADPDPVVRSAVARALRGEPT